jgi:hypothetical protein
MLRRQKINLELPGILPESSSLDASPAMACNEYIWSLGLLADPSLNLEATCLPYKT